LFSQKQLSHQMTHNHAKIASAQIPLSNNNNYGNGFFGFSDVLLPLFSLGHQVLSLATSIFFNQLFIVHHINLIHDQKNLMR
jgi:hypothetical protein